MSLYVTNMLTYHSCHCRFPTQTQTHFCQTDHNILVSSGQFRVTAISIRHESLCYVTSTGPEWEHCSRMHPEAPPDMPMYVLCNYYQSPPTLNGPNSPKTAPNLGPVRPWFLTCVGRSILSWVQSAQRKDQNAILVN